MTRKTRISSVTTGIANLDALLGGGIPKGSMTIVSGTAGSGKTVLCQQICFNNASKEAPCVYFTTLSEPTAKALKYISQFDFFDPAKIGEAVQFIDLGSLLKSGGIQNAAALILDQVKRIQPAFVVIDSFRVFDDLTRSREELRKFGYELAVNLMAWEPTVLFAGEYTDEERATNPLFSIADGLIVTSQGLVDGEQRRLLQVVKLRGAAHDRDVHPFSISPAGIEIYAPRLTLRRTTEQRKLPTTRCLTHISRLDELIGEGLPWGSTLLISGVAGTGKTVASLEFLYRGAVAGERGILFSFEETIDRLFSSARGMGWDLESHVKSGMLELHFIPQPDIRVEEHLLFMDERVQQHKAKRVVIDSVSVFLHRVENPQVARDKAFQLATLVQNAQAVGFLTTDIPYGSDRISRFGVEETVVDGVILLSATSEGMHRQRYIEIYKLRSTFHLQGRHCLIIGPRGIEIYPRYSAEDAQLTAPPPPLGATPRIRSGVPGLDRLIGGGLVERSTTLLSGSTGIGKSTVGLQFALAGASRRRKSLFVSFEERPAQIQRDGEAIGLRVREAVEKGSLELMYLPRSQVRAAQHVTLITERIEALGVRRVVLDGVNHIAEEARSGDELELLLYALVNRFKRMSVTSLLTLEAPSLFSMENATERQLSEIADNLFLLRYRRTPSNLESELTILKSRGNAHDRGTHTVLLREGGLHVERPDPRKTL